MNSLFLFFLPLFVFSYTTRADSFRVEIGDGSTVELSYHNLNSNDEMRLASEKERELGYYNPFSSSKASKSLKNRMTIAKHQGEKRGMCSAFVTVGLIEFFHGGDFSEQCLSKLASPIDSSNVYQRFNWALTHGLYWEDDCPYFNEPGERDEFPDLSNKAIFWPIPNYVFTAQKIADPIGFIKGKIDRGSPVIISIIFAGDWMKQKIIELPSKEEIEKSCKKIKGGFKKCLKHGVIVTGYNDELGYLEFKNSWGINWPKGSEKWMGYGRMSYSYFLKLRTTDSFMVSK